MSFKKFAYLFLAIFFTALAVVGGLMLLVIPAFIALTHVAFVKFIAVEEDIKPMDALKKSSAMTKGQRWHIFTLIVVGVLVNVIGALCLLVGLLFTMPLTIIAMTLVYKKLARQTEEVVDSMPSDTAVVTEVIEVIEVVEE